MNCPLGLTSLALFSALTAGAATNLIANGSFEDAEDNAGIAGWSADAAGMKTVTFARDTEVKRSGVASARIAIANEANPSWPAYVSNLAVQPGQCFRIEAWASTRDVAQVAYVAADYLDANGKRVSFASNGSVKGTTEDWQRIELLAHIPTGAVTMSVRLILYGNGMAWFDDVSVVRDQAYEKVMASMLAPLPAEMITRGTTAVGDLARLHHLFQAAAKGGTYTVGIVGGSITAGAAASSMDKHYSAFVINWFKEHFPAAEWRFVNAGIGATGTNYGCLRAQRDLLSKEPDVVVSEYGVNDADTQECAETYEGLLRQILASSKRPPVLMLFMMAQAGNNAQQWQSKLGRHYNLPMLSYRDMLWPEIEAKQMTWTDISPDSVHPNDVGHAYTGKLLASLLDQALTALPATPVPSADAALPPPLLTDVYQFTHLLEAEDLKPLSHDGWAYDTSNAWAKAWTATTPGSVVEFEITGEQLFVSYWRIRGAMGRAQITIDGGTPSVQEAWFDQTWGGYRHMIQLPTGGPGKHLVRLELLADRHPDSTGTEFRLVCLGTAGK